MIPATTSAPYTDVKDNLRHGSYNFSGPIKHPNEKPSLLTMERLARMSTRECLPFSKSQNSQISGNNSRSNSDSSFSSKNSNKSVKSASKPDEDVVHCEASHERPMSVMDAIRRDLHFMSEEHVLHTERQQDKLRHSLRECKQVMDLLKRAQEIQTSINENCEMLEVCIQNGYACPGIQRDFLAENEIIVKPDKDEQEIENNASYCVIDEMLHAKLKVSPNEDQVYDPSESMDTFDEESLCSRGTWLHRRRDRSSITNAMPKRLPNLNRGGPFHDPDQDMESRQQLSRIPAPVHERLQYVLESARPPKKSKRYVKQARSRGRQAVRCKTEDQRMKESGLWEFNDERVKTKSNREMRRESLSSRSREDNPRADFDNSVSRELEKILDEENFLEPALGDPNVADSWSFNPISQALPPVYTEEELRLTGADRSRQNDLPRNRFGRRGDETTTKSNKNQKRHPKAHVPKVGLDMVGR